jgi:hypothetical protein
VNAVRPATLALGFGELFLHGVEHCLDRAVELLGVLGVRQNTESGALVFLPMFLHTAVTHTQSSLATPGTTSAHDPHQRA